MHVDSTAASLWCNQSLQKALCRHNMPAASASDLGGNRPHRGIAWNSQLVMRPVPAPVAPASSCLRYASCLRLQRRMPHYQTQ